MSQDTAIDSTTLPVLPLRDVIVFPHTVVPLFVGRERSMAAIGEAMRHQRSIVLVAQKQARTEEPVAEDLYEVGCRAQIVQQIRLPDGTVKVLVEGLGRVRLLRMEATQPCFIASVELLKSSTPVGTETEALVRTVLTTFETYARLSRSLPSELLASLSQIDDHERVIDTVIHHVGLKIAEKQALLEEVALHARAEKLLQLLQAEVEILQVERKIRTRVKKQVDQNQKEYYLNEQMQAIQKELGEKDDAKGELQELEEKLQSRQMPAEPLARARRELKKLRGMPPMSAEATVVRNYLDWILALPWDTVSTDRVDAAEATALLDADHAGLAKVKDRILEFLAVQQLAPKLRGPILCFVGPPGVGKTSLARSIARCMNRQFVRIALGGVRDEAEIRGHRRTYIGALPGKIVQSLKRAGSGNPVILLDEIDKMSSDFRGDPASALLEVLDPEQNHAFGDHYLDLDVDLSKVLFVCTANTLSGIPLPLLDRLEMIEVPSYTDLEKTDIARRYLWPKQLQSNGLEGVRVELTDRALHHVIHHYTREAGVRTLDRMLAAVCRKVARGVLNHGKERAYKVTSARVERLLGPRQFEVRRKETDDQIGLVNGLAYTQVGGVMLPIEVATVPGKGKLTLTGKLGESLKESAQAGLTYVRSRAGMLGIDASVFETTDIHVHYPGAGAGVDGPSAGLAMALALVSALCQVPVRQDLALTGEVSLRGKALVIGGLKEKALGAHRAGVKTLVIPRENEKDLPDIPAAVRRSLRIVAVDHMDEVLRLALALDDVDGYFAAARRRLGREALRTDAVPALRDDESAGPTAGYAA